MPFGFDLKIVFLSHFAAASGLVWLSVMAENKLLVGVPQLERQLLPPGPNAPSNTQGAM